MEKGKDPEGNRKAFEPLWQWNGMESDTKAIVFEGTLTGILAGVAGAYPVIGLSMTFSKEKLLGAESLSAIDDLLRAKAVKNGGVIILTIRKQPKK